MTNPVLSVKNLSTHFFTRAGVVKAVDGVSFDLARGEIMGLVGESGSGKTVTGFSLLGLVDAPGRIVEGSVKLNGTELTTLPEKTLRNRRGREISMIFQDPIATLNPMLTIGQQMRMAVNAHESLSARAADASWHPIRRRKAAGLSARIFRRYATTRCDCDCPIASTDSHCRG
jgi:peptide/nickel transport system ATP-binding protein